MAAQRHDVEILLKVTQEGLSNVDKLTERLEELRSALSKRIGTNALAEFTANALKSGRKDLVAIGQEFTALEKAATRSVEQLNKVLSSLGSDIGGVKSLERIQELLNKIGSGQKVDLREAFKTEGLVDSFKIFISNLKEAQKLAKSAGNIELFDDIARQVKDAQAANRELNKFIKSRDDLNRNPAQLSAETTEKFKQAVKEVGDLQKQFEIAKKGGNLGAVKDTISAGLQKVRKSINDVIDAKRALGQDAQIAIDKRAELDKFQKKVNLTSKAINSLNNQEVELKTKISGDLDSTKGGITKLNADIQKALKQGNVEIIPTLVSRKAELEAQLGVMEADIRKFNDSAQLRIFNKATSGLNNAESGIVDLQNFARNHPVNLISNAAQLEHDIDLVEGRLSGLVREVKKFADVGNSVHILPSAHQEINVIIADLERLIKEKQRLGEDTQSLQLRLLGAQEFKQQLGSLGVQADEVVNKKRTVRAELDYSLEQIKKKASELERDFQDAVKNKDFKAIAKLEVRRQGLVGEQSGLKSSAVGTNDESVLRGFDKQAISLAGLGKQFRDFQQSAPTGIFAKLGQTISDTNKKIGGSSTIFRALGSSIRVMGTAGFLAGGQFRTLGFALSALGSIVQNVLPLFFQIGGALGPVIGGALGGIAIGFTAIAAKILIAGAALAEFIKVGFEFNALSENTQNSVAALIAEFFTISQGGKVVGEGLGEGQAATARFAAASELAAEQVHKLAIEAITTQFTTKELFQTFQAVAVALGPYAVNVNNITKLTGLFARAASVARVPAEALGTAVQNIISGNARANKLQGLFNQLSDSKGIALTAKHIKELRAAGGDKLITELSRALEKLTVAAGVAQAQSFTGVISNFQDALNLISGDATQKAFEAFRNGLGGTFKIVDGEFKQLTEGLISKLIVIGKSGVELTAPVKQLIASLSPILEKISQDVVKFLGSVLDYVLRIGTYLEQNGNKLLEIWETTKFILTTLGGIYGDIVNIIAGTNEESNTLSALAIVLQFIAETTNIIRGFFDLMVIGIGLILILAEALLRVVINIGIAADAVLSFLASGGKSVESGLGRALKAVKTELIEIEDRTGRMVNAAVDGFTAAQDATERYHIALRALRVEQELQIKQKDKEKKARVGQIITEGAKAQSQAKGNQKKQAGIELETIKRLVKDEGLTEFNLKGLGFSKDDIDKATKFETTPNKPAIRTDQKDKKGGRSEHLKSQLAALKELNDAKLGLFKQELDNEFNLAQSNIERQKSIIQDLVEFRIISEQRASVEVAKLRRQELDNEIIKRNATIGEIRTKNRQDQLAFLKESRDINKEENTKKDRNKPFGEARRLSRQSELETRRKAAEIKGNTAVLAQLGEIELLKRRELEIEQDLLRFQTQRLIKIDEELRKTRTRVSNLSDPTSNTSFKNNVGQIIQQSLPDIIDLDNEINALNDEIRKSIDDLDEKSHKFFTNRLRQDLELKKLKLEEIDLLIKEESAKQINLFLDKERNALRFNEEQIQRQIALGTKDEKQGIVEITAARQQLVPVLQKALDILKAQGETTPEQINRINDLKNQIADFSKEITEGDLLKASNEIKDNFVDFFDKLQENIGDAKNSFADLAKSILGTFRRLISQKIVEQLFGSLFEPTGKTEGKVQGLVGKFLKIFGLGKENGLNEQVAKQKEINPVTGQEANEKLGQIANQNKSLDGFSQSLIDTVNAVKEYKELTRNAGEELAQISLKANKLGIDLSRVSGGLEAINLEILNTNINQVSSVILNSLIPELEILVSTLQAGAGQQKPNPFGNIDLGSLIDEEAEGRRHGGLIKKFAKGGKVGNRYNFVSGGANTSSEDSVPAFLSNGEFVMTRAAVNMFGLGLMESLNGFAGGGFINDFSSGYKKPLIDALKFNYEDGGASLRNKPAPIVEQVAQAKKKTGRFRRIFGGILSAVAPFLNFIPVIGPFLALGAGAAGGALTGSANGGLKGGLLGGLFGGLSNLGGFAGGTGKFASFSKFFSSGPGKLITNIGNSSVGNQTANTSGSLAELLSGKGKSGGSGLSGILGKLRGILGKLGLKFAGGGQVDSKQLIALFGILSSLGGLFNKKPAQEEAEPEFIDPDLERKNRFGSAYRPFIDAGILADFQYSPESYQKLFGGKLSTAPSTKKRGGFLSGIFGFLGQILPFLAAFAGSKGSYGSFKGLGSPSVNPGNGNVFAAKGGLIKRLADGGFVEGAGSGTSDSILSLLSNGEYVINAKAVKMLGTGLLESLNSGRYAFADGGLVGDGMVIPSLGATAASPNVNVNTPVNIYNMLDQDSLVGEYFQTSSGQKVLLNFISKNRKTINTTLGK
jgi:hypothetical protein